MSPGCSDICNMLSFQLSGVAFIVLGVAALLTMRRSGETALARDLGWLAIFGCLHGLQALLDGVLVSHPVIWLAQFSTILLIVAFAALLEFSRRLWNEQLPGQRLLALLLYAVLALGIIAYMLMGSPVATGVERGLVYLFGAAAATLAGIGLFAQGRAMGRAADIVALIVWLQLAAVTLLAYAALMLFFSAIYTQLLPARPDFLLTVNLPLQLARAGFALMLAVSFVMLNQHIGSLSATSLRRVTNRLNGFVYRCRNDKNWTVIFMSAGGERLTGYPATDFLSCKRHFAQQIHPEDQQHVWDDIQAALALRQDFRLQYRMINGAGTVCWCYEEGRGVFDTQGNLLYLEGLVRNDEERHQEQKLLVRLSRVASATTNGVIVTDIHGRVEWINEGFSRITGYTLDEIQGRKPGEVLQGPDTNPATVAKIRASLILGEGFDAELINYTCDGKPYWVHILCSPLHDEKGIFQGFMAIESDISQQKHAQKVLAEQVQHTQAILDNMVDGIITIDASGIMQSFNQAAMRIFGYTADEVLGKNVNMLMPAPHRQAHDGYLTNYQRGGIAKIIGIGREVDGQRKDGSLFPMKLAISEVIRNGQPLYVGLVSDISERKQFEMQLLELNQSLEQRVAKRTEELEHANAAKNDFLSRMSHELRTPLNAILGFTQLLQLPADLPLSPQQADNVQEIRDAGAHLLELVNDILDLARIEAGKLDFDTKPVLLQPVIEQCVRQISAAAQQRSITVSLQSDCTCYVNADVTRLRQILLNLLSNAVKYNREAGSVELDCTLQAAQTVRISVRDTGVGISADQVSRLFKPFARLDSAYNGIAGSGIGLALARQLVECMQGSIGVSSVPGKGSCFWFELPLCKGTAEASVKPLSAPAVMNTAQAQRSPVTILYIEDNPANLRLVQKILTKRSNTVLLTAENGEQGLLLADSKHPQLILLDINMPGMDGFEVLRRLQANPLTSQLPVIAISANAMQGDIERGKAAGFVDYITKPLQVPAFLQSIEHGLQHKVTYKEAQL